MAFGISAATWAMVGAGVAATGTLMEGQSQAMASEYNADVARQNAAIAAQQGKAAVELQQRNAKRTIGTMVANYGASGVQVDSGSPLDVLADSASMAELDKLTTQYNYALRGLGYSQQANLADMNASSASTSSLLGAVGKAASGYGTYLKMGGGTPIPG